RTRKNLLLQLSHRYGKIRTSLSRNSTKPRRFERLTVAAEHRGHFTNIGIGSETECKKTSLLAAEGRQRNTDYHKRLWVVNRRQLMAFITIDPDRPLSAKPRKTENIDRISRPPISHQLLQFQPRARSSARIERWSPEPKASGSNPLGRIQKSIGYKHTRRL